MTKTSTKLALLVLGVLSGVVGTSVARSALGTSAPALVVVPMPPRPTFAASRVSAAALDCGVYGLPGSPAVVALTAGLDGRPARAVLESDIFGGTETEACILAGVAGLAMHDDTLRSVLPVHVPEDSEAALAIRLFAEVRRRRGWPEVARLPLHGSRSALPTRWAEGLHSTLGGVGSALRRSP